METITEERRALRRNNQGNDTLTVLAELKAKLPDVWEQAEVVGKWVWIEFPMMPSKEVRETLLDMGFHWNHTRRCWQHSCGAFCHHTTGNPRWKYVSLPAKELDSSQVPA